MSMHSRIAKKFWHAISGLRYAGRYDPGFRLQVAGGAVAVVLIVYFLRPLCATESLFLLLAVALVWITELQNSALEHLIDHLHPEEHAVVKHVKDMAAAAVLLAGSFAGAVLLVLLFSRSLW